jgi:hypothetical protein
MHRLSSILRDDFRTNIRSRDIQISAFARSRPGRFSPRRHYIRYNKYPQALQIFTCSAQLFLGREGLNHWQGKWARKQESKKEGVFR